MPRTYNKNVIRTFRSTRSRFFAIFSIVALGVGFLAGLSATPVDMKESMERYMDDGNFYDVRVLSTLGLTDDDVQALRQVPGVQTVQPAYSADLLVQTGEDNVVARAHSLPPDGDDAINRLVPAEGRLPQSPDECLVEVGATGLNPTYPVGTTFTVTAENEDLDSKLNRTQFTVVGLVHNSNYFSYEREPAGVGSGAVQVVMYLQPDAFAYEAYTEIYLTAAGAKEQDSLTEPYRQTVQAVTDNIAAIQDERCQARYDGLLADARAELDDAWQKYYEAEADAEAQLADAAAQLEDGRNQLQSGKNKLADGRRQYADGKTQLENGTNQMLDGQAQLNDALGQWYKADAEWQQGKQELDSGKAQLDENEPAYRDGVQQLADALGTDYATVDKFAADLAAYCTAQGIAPPDTAQDMLELLLIYGEGLPLPKISDEQLRQIRDAAAELRPKLDDIPADMLPDEQKTLLEEAKVLVQALADAETSDEMWAALQNAYTWLQDHRDLLPDEVYEALNALILGALQKEELNKLAAALAGMVKFKQAQQQYESGLQQLTDARTQLDDAYALLQEKMVELGVAQGQLLDAQGRLDAAWRDILNGQRKIDENEKKLTDAEAEYADAKAEAEQKLADARAEIEDGEAKLDELEKPEWYVWDRSKNTSFGSFKANVDKLTAITTVFPVFFFLVAALVVSTTMTRMVEEERLQIGTLKALGYARGTIMQKYLWYAFGASALGAVVGLAVGFRVFPAIIWSGYSIMYYMPEIATPWRLQQAVFAGASLIGLSLGVTAMACRTSLAEVPAALMLPRAPKAGKRILLERITPLWRRLPFTWKVTCRNLLRYKKRFWMTVIGVAGCTALLVAGFGLSDSLNGIITKQFDNVSHYDLMTVVSKEQAVREGAVYDYLFEDSETFPLSMAAAVQSTHCDSADGETELYLMVPQDLTRFAQLMDLHERIGGEPTPLTDDGIVLTEKLAKTLGAAAGDTVTLKNADGDTAEFTVTGVCEHYISNYAYITPAVYTAAFGKAPTYNAVLSTLTDESAENRAAISEKLLGIDTVVSLTFTQDAVKQVLNMLNSIDAVVVLIIVCAAMLAFVVLYNLSNINIAERVKEIATIKVLGFYDREVYSYVNRESTALACIGTALGLALGKALHAFIITTVEVDSVMFGRDIAPQSYLYAVALTLVFSTAVNLVMGRKLKAISMVESMKAPE